MENELELNEEIKEVQPIIEAVTTSPIRVGWLTIRHKTVVGGAIMVKGDQWNRTYKDDVWEIVESKKK